MWGFDLSQPNIQSLHHMAAGEITLLPFSCICDDVRRHTTTLNEVIDVCVSVSLKSDASLETTTPQMSGACNG